MLPDLGKYAFYVLTSYGAALAILIAVAAASLHASARAGASWRRWSGAATAADADPTGGKMPKGSDARARLWMALPLAIFAVIAAMFLFGLGRDKDTLPSALIAKPAPEFALPPLREGEAGLDTAALKEPGVKLVNVWASWCGPCRVEHPKLEELAALGAVIHGINYKDERANALGFLDEMGDPYATIGMDERGRAGIEWGVYGVPETFVIDGEGRIAYKHVGPIQNDDLETKILPAMREAGWTGG